MNAQPLLRRPAGALAAFVDCIWLWDGYAAPAPRERALPGGGADFIVNLGENRLGFGGEVLAGSVLSGAHAEAVDIETPGRIHVMGVHFRPGGAYPFFDMAAHELAGKRVAWEPEVRARLLEAPTAEARIGLMERLLLERATLKHHTVLDSALRAFEDPNLRSVAAVNDATGLSPKRLGALFRDRVGLTPKAYWRVRRFQAALRGLEAGAANRAELAVRVGYFDQAHLDREFRVIAGMSPREYLAYRVERPNHVPLR